MPEHHPSNRNRSLRFEQLEDRTNPAAIPTVTLPGFPTETLIGQNFGFTAHFDNTSPSDAGYGPYMDLYFPATGKDGGGSQIDDGITYSSATFMGLTLNATVVTLTTNGVPHPFARDANGNPVLITPPSGFQAGDQLVVLELPYGSFTPTQPAIDVNVQAKVSNLADANAPLSVQAQGGFRFGNDPLDNPRQDPTIIGPASTGAVEPTVMRLTKTYVGPEDETTTGPNFPRQYRVQVDIADGQTLTDLDLTDVLDARLQFLSVDSTSGATTAINTPSMTVPGGTLTRRFASVTGTNAAVDAEMVFSFYVPLLDASGQPVIDPTTGDDRTAIDDASSTADWIPLDPRDPPTTITSDTTPIDHTLTLKSLAIQKSVRVVIDTGAPGPTPGDTLEYTLNFQVSDYFAFNNLVMTDLFSDGQEYVVGSANLDATDGHGVGGSSSGVMNASRAILSRNVVGGSDRLVLRISDELAARGFSTGGRLVGGAIPDGGTGGPPPQSASPLPFGATSGVVRFRTVIQNEFEIDFPSGNPAINSTDELGNSVTINGNLLSVADLLANGQTEGDTSNATTTIVGPSFEKLVYAINGVIASDPSIGYPASTPISVNDRVTYRLRLNLPVGSVEQLRITDYLPLPIFDVDTTGRISGFDAVVSGAAPAAGRAKFGPADTFFNRSGIVPTVSNDSLANSVGFDYGTYDDPDSRALVIDLLFTVAVSNTPFTDGLLLTNDGRAQSQNTELVAINNGGIGQITISQPQLNITKGVIATNNPVGQFTPTTVGPVPFNAPGTTGSRFAGTITSAGLQTTPINSNLTNIDAADQVSFAVVIENVGSGRFGAFDVVIQDNIPNGFIRTGVGVDGVNLRVTNGAGVPIPYITIGNGFFDANGGIQLIDPSLTQGAIGRGSIDGVTVNDGGNIVVITYDLETIDTRPAELLRNTGSVTSYANSEGGPDFTGSGSISDTADVTTTPIRIAKTLVSTEIENVYNSRTEAVIGEIATYRVTITVPEGVVPTTILTDLLDAQLAFVDMESVILSPGVSITGSTIPDVNNSGRNIRFDLGEITNADDDNQTLETITLTYRAVVLNVASAQENVRVNNRADLTYVGIPATLRVSAENITIIEPRIEIEKTVQVGSTADRGQAGDTVVYTIVLRNRPGSAALTADAFDATFSDALPVGPGGNSYIVSPTFIVVDSAGVVTAASFELVGSAATGFTLRTRSTGAFDLLVDPTRAITITITGMIDLSVAPGISFPNIATVQWTSLDGDPGQRSLYNPDSTERTGSGGINDYRAQDSAVVNIKNALIEKRLVTTSENATVEANRVVVGEIVRFRLQVTLSEATAIGAQIADYLPDGMQFLDDGTTLVAFVGAATDTITSTTISDPNPGTGPELFQVGDATTVDSIVPDFPFNAAAIEGGPFTNGTDVIFDFGTVVYSSNTEGNGFIVLEFNALVTNVVSNQAGVELINTAELYVMNEPTGTTSQTIVQVSEPQIKNLQKLPVTILNDRFALVSNPDAGDTIRYRVDYSNQLGDTSSVAYDVTITDVLPAGKMELIPSTVTVLRNGVVLTSGYRDHSTIAGVNLTIDEVAPGDQIVIRYDVVLLIGVRPDEIIVNTVDLVYTSLPDEQGTDPNPTGSTTPGTSGSSTGERNGSGGINDYNDVSSASIRIATPELEKLIVETSISETTANQFDVGTEDLIIGEEVVYLLVITLPEGTTEFNLLDQLPIIFGILRLNDARILSIGSNIIGSNLQVGDAGIRTDTNGDGILDRALFDFGTVVNLGDNVLDDRDQIVVELTGQVLNRPINVEGVTLVNHARMDYTTGHVDASASAEIVEPTLEIAKMVMSSTRVDAGEIVTYRVVVQHAADSNAIAFNPLIIDALPPGLQVVGIPQIIYAPDYQSSFWLPPTIRVVGNSIEFSALWLDHPGSPDSIGILDEFVIEYQALVVGPPNPNAVAPDSSIVNSATLDYDSYFIPSSVDPDVSRRYDTEDSAQISLNSNSLSGFVYVDANDNGIFDLGEMPLDGVTIQLIGRDHLGNIISRTDSTSFDGSYRFDQVRPGTYSLIEPQQPAGYVDGQDTPGTPFGGIAMPPNGDTIFNIVIPLGADRGEEFDSDGEDYNFGELPPASVGDFIWNDRNGNGRQDKGEPGLAGVLVTLTGQDQDGNSVQRTTTTNSLGGYLIDLLRPGNYAITVTPLAGFQFTVFRSAVATPDSDSDVIPTTGRSPNFDITIGQIDLSRDAGMYRPASVGDHVWWDVNGDGVLQSGEPGIPGVSIRVTWDGPDGVPGTADDQTFRATTNARGNYLITSLPPGGYQVVVINVPVGFTIQTSGISSFQLDEGQNRRDIDFGYRGPGAIGDLVWLDVIPDGVRANNEPGIPNVEVRLVYLGPDGVVGGGDDLILSTRTDASGGYQFMNLPLGVFEVVVVTSTLPATASPTYDLDSGTTNPDGRTRVVLTADRSIEERADFGYATLTSFGDRVWLDFNGNGRQDADEPGLRGVTLAADWAGYDNRFGTSDDQRYLRTTGGNGIYSFSSIPAGSYRVAITGGLPAGVRQTYDPDGQLDGATAFRINVGQVFDTIDFGYQGDSAISGFVYTDYDINGRFEPNAQVPEQGIRNVTITLTGTDIARNVVRRVTSTGVDGAYRFDGLLAGDYRIIETQPPGPTQPEGFYDGLDTPGLLVPPTSPRGVRDQITPVKNQLSVSLPTARTAIDYNFGENPPASTFGYVYLDENFNGMRDPGEPGIPGVTITINGQAFPNTVLERALTAVDVPGGLMILTDANGFWNFAILPPGTYSVVETQPAGFDDGPEQDADPNPPPRAVIGDDRFDNINLAPFRSRGAFNFGERLFRGSISGGVYFDKNANLQRDPDEVGIGGVTIVLTGTDILGNPVQQTTSTDADGNFRFPDLRPGRYSLSEVQPIGYIAGGVTPGSNGGTASYNRIANIDLGANENAVLNLFGELLPPPVNPPVPVPSDPLQPGEIGKSEFLTSTSPGVMTNRAPSFATTPQAYALMEQETIANGFPAPAILVATAEGAGGLPEVRVFDFTAGVERRRFLAYDPSFQGGVRTAIADVTGDGQPDVITAAGPTGGPHVRVFDGVSGEVFREWFAYDASFTGGVFVAAADVNGDGFADVITGAGAGGAPHVQVFDGLTGQVLRSFFAYASSLRGGVTVAAADVNSDDYADIITGAGVGGGPHVQVFSGADATILQSYFAFDPTFTGGIFVAAGDVDGDGDADVVIGTGPGALPEMRIYSGRDTSPLFRYEIDDANHPNGVRVSTADINGDRKDEVVIARGENTRSMVRIIQPESSTILEEFLAFEPLFLGGVYVG